MILDTLAQAFFPEDAHAPSCAWDRPEEVLKVVVKVQV